MRIRSCTEIVLYRDRLVPRSSCTEIVLYRDRLVPRSSCTEIVLYRIRSYPPSTYHRLALLSSCNIKGDAKLMCHPTSTMRIGSNSVQSGTFKVIRKPFVKLLSMHVFVKKDGGLKHIPLCFVLMSHRRKRITIQSSHRSRLSCRRISA